MSDEPTNAATTTVHLVGDLDMATRQRAQERCSPSGSDDVAVDLTLLTFLDCAGYRALNGARLELLPHGRHLALVNATGQPLRLLTMIADIERREPA